MKTIAIIPARLNSTRLPRKLLELIGGEELIIKTYKAISKSLYINKIVVATDSIEIVNVCQKYNIDSIMTDSSLPSGSDRIYQAYEKISEDYDYILNVQGDEPLINFKDIDKLIIEFSKSFADVGTIKKQIESIEELKESSNVKLITNSKNEAIYFSRAIIPYIRDIEIKDYLEYHKFYKHIGIYIYKNEVLKSFVNLPQGNLEKLEKLEQLRFLENGYKIFCTETKNKIIGVDTKEDLKKVREIFETL